MNYDSKMILLKNFDYFYTHVLQLYYHLHHTWVVDVLVVIKVTASCIVAIGVVGKGVVAVGVVAVGVVAVCIVAMVTSVGCVVAKQHRRYQDTFLPQVTHEELQTNQSEDTEAKHCQNHDISKLLH